jgi:polyisoprenoid-binding protein YceI
MTKSTKWIIDTAHSAIYFKVRHLMISNIIGSFKIFDASIYTSGEDFTTVEVDLWIDASSVSTGDTKRDNHLLSAEFFDVKKHKQINFVASTMTKGSNDLHELWGELTMIGITKNIKINTKFNGLVKDPEGKEKAGFELTGKINRSDWGLTWNTALEAGGWVVSDEVIISCELELNRATAEPVLAELASVSQKQLQF